MDAEFPPDIKKAVDAIFDGIAADESLADALARALLAERERAANIVANGYLDLKEMRRLTALIRS